jgi:putative SOS response-associated peptidase YedK
MCGRYYSFIDKQLIADRFRLPPDLYDFVLPGYSYNIAPSTFQPVIRNTKETGKRELVLMRWGLIPNYTKDLKTFKVFSTINARAETVTNSPMWRGPFQRHRCLVPASGFYEWKKLDAKTKQPYAIHLKSNEPMAFAGLWDAWKDTEGGWLQSFSIITTEANELMSSIHERMPVILRPADYDRWLSREVTDQPPVDLLRPYDSDEMAMYPVDPRVGNVRNDEPGLCEPYSCPPNSA